MRERHRLVRVWVVRGLVCLLLGLATTVVVAWGITRRVQDFSAHDVFSFTYVKYAAGLDRPRTGRMPRDPAKKVDTGRLSDFVFQVSDARRVGSAWRAWSGSVKWTGRYHLYCGPPREISSLHIHFFVLAFSAGREPAHRKPYIELADCRPGWGEWKRTVSRLMSRPDLWRDSALYAAMESNCERINQTNWRQEVSCSEEFFEGTELSGLVMAGYEEARGWPMLALSVRLSLDDPTGPMTCIGRARVHGGIAVPHGWTGSARAGATTMLLPLTPIWPGLLMNTAFYTAAWLLVVAGRGMLKRYRQRRRQRRGRCSACGYDLVGDLAGGCPECGWNRSPGEAATS